MSVSLFVKVGVRWKRRHRQSVQYQCIVTMDDFCSIYVSELTLITYELYMKLAEY